TAAHVEHRVDPAVLDVRDVLHEPADAERARGGREPCLVVGESERAEADDAPLVGEEAEEGVALGVVRGRKSGHAPILTDETGQPVTGFDQSAFVLPFFFIICFHSRTRASVSGESMSATDRGVSSANGPAASCHPSGRTPIRLARIATKMRAFSSPYPGSARRRAKSSSPVSASFHTRSAAPP